MQALNRIFQALALLGALASATLYWSLTKEDRDAQAQLEFARRQLTALQGQKSTLQAQLDEQATSLHAAVSERDAAAAKRLSLSAQLGQLQRENERLVEERDARKATEQRLQAENARLKEGLAETRARSVPQEQVVQYEEKIAALERALLDLKQTTSTLAAAGGAKLLAPPPANPALSGSVLTVGKGSSFVVLDIGYSDGVRLQSELLVQHADTPIAKIQVTEVKENLSIARVLPESLIKTPQTGDAVSSLN